MLLYLRFYTLKTKGREVFCAFLVFCYAALLLFIPESEENKGIIPGKLFEYLATRKPIFAFGPVGSDVQAILANTKSGFYYESHQAEKAAADLQQLIEGKTSFSPNENEINNYTRKAQAKQLKHIIWSK